YAHRPPPSANDDAAGASDATRGAKARPRAPLTCPLVVRDLDGDAHRRDAVAGMIVQVGELREPVELLRHVRRALEQAGVEVDRVDAGRAGGGERDLHVAL